MTSRVSDVVQWRHGNVTLVCIICTHHYVTSPFALQDLGDGQREIGSTRARAALGHPLTGKLDPQAPRAPQSSVTPIPHDSEWLLRDDSKLTAPSAANPFTCEGISGGRGWLARLVKAHTLPTRSLDELFQEARSS